MKKIISVFLVFATISDDGIITISGNKRREKIANRNHYYRNIFCVGWGKHIFHF